MTPEVAKKFKYWQTRTIIASMIGYALFYFVRKNLSIAMPAMQEDLGITKGDLGLFLTLHGLLYGVSKFANGFIGDRVNARYFMVTGWCFPPFVIFCLDLVPQCLYLVLFGC